MPRGQTIPHERRTAIYHAYCMGEKPQDIAEREGVTKQTVYNIVREQRKVQEKMPRKNSIVAGDKRNGRLMSTPDPHRYEGTCVIGGKAHSKAFVATNAKKAEEMWRKWCDGLRGEQEFMDMVERRKPEPVEEVVPEVEASVPIDTGKPIYVIWAKTEKPSLYGAYLHISDALRKLDELNDVAAFLGNDKPFEVEEVAWR